MLPIFVNVTHSTDKAVFLSSPASFVFIGLKPAYHYNIWCYFCSLYSEIEFSWTPSFSQIISKFSFSWGNVIVTTG